MSKLIPLLKENIEANIKGGTYKELSLSYLCFDFENEHSDKIRILALNPDTPDYDFYYLRRLINNSILKDLHIVLFYDDDVTTTEEIYAQHQELNIYCWNEKEQKLYWETTKYIEENEIEETSFDFVLSDLDHTKHFYQENHIYKFARVKPSKAYVEYMDYQCPTCQERMAASIGYLFPFHEDLAQFFNEAELYTSNGDYLVSLYCMSKSIVKVFSEFNNKQDMVKGLKVSSVVLDYHGKDQQAEILCPHCKETVSRKVIDNYRYFTLVEGDRKNLIFYIPCEAYVDYLSMFFSNRRQPYKEYEETRLKYPYRTP